MGETEEFTRKLLGETEEITQKEVMYKSGEKTVRTYRKRRDESI